MEKFRWLRYVCCVFAIVAIGVVGYEKATEPTDPIPKDSEPSARRFDHLSFTNGSDVPVTKLTFTAKDEMGGPFLDNVDYANPVQPGQTVSLVFNEERDFGMTFVEVTAEFEAGGPQSKYCRIMVDPEWNINSAKFWLGLPEVGTSSRVIAGEGVLCNDDEMTRRVIPHEESAP